MGLLEHQQQVGAVEDLFGLTVPTLKEEEFCQQKVEELLLVAVGTLIMLIIIIISPGMVVEVEVVGLEPTHQTHIQLYMESA